MNPSGGWTGLTTGPEPDLVVNLYKRRNRYWPTTPIPSEFEGYPVRVWKTGRPVAAI